MKRLLLIILIGVHVQLSRRSILVHGQGAEQWAIDTNQQQESSGSNSNYFTYETCTWGYRGNPSDCGTYYQCNFGQALLRPCPPGLFWNSAVSTCDWPTNVRGAGVECVDRRGGGSGSGGSGNKGQIPDAEDTVVIDGEYDEGEAVRTEPCTSGEFRADPDSCTTYFMCVHGTLITHNCPLGLNWNQDLKICDWPYSSPCKLGAGSPEVPGVPTDTTGTEQVQQPTQPEVTIPAGETVSGLATPSPPIPQIPGSAPSEYKVICYFTDWAWYRPGLGKYAPPNINPSLCTHIIYSFTLLNKNDFVIRIADSWADVDNKFYEQVTNLKKSNKVKVSVAIGGWNDSEGDGYSRLVNSPANRAKFVTSVVQFLKQYNFDGIDLDWEYPQCWQGDCKRGPSSDKAGFAALVQELRQALPPSALLSAAVSASKAIVAAGYDVPTLAANLDWIGVMDYDFHGSWDRKTGHIAPLYYTPGDDFDYFNVNSSINYWMSAGAPANKLIVGIPLYGQSFTLADSKQTGLNAPSYGPGTAGQFTRQGGVLSYYEICGQTWTKVVQNPTGAMGPYAYKDNQWVSFDDVNFVTVKSNYVKSRALGGAMIWALDFDDFGNTCGQGEYPLLSAISSTLKNV